MSNAGSPRVPPPSIRVGSVHHIHTNYDLRCYLWRVAEGVAAEHLGLPPLGFTSIKTTSCAVLVFFVDYRVLERLEMSILIR
jgi:hypothetical protein